MGNDPTMVTMRERVRVVKTDLDNPGRPPEIIEQETLTKISLDEAALLGFAPGQGFVVDATPKQPSYLVPQEYAAAIETSAVKWNVKNDGPPSPIEGAQAGDE